MPKAALLEKPQHVRLIDRDPLIPAGGEVVIQVQTAGICGTDLALFSGDYPVPLPLVLGHEFTGSVRKLGDGVESTWLGKRVTAEINNTCVALGQTELCVACRKGLPSHCQKRNVTGIIEHDGAFAEEICVPAGALHELPENLDPVTASLTEPLAAALQTFVMTPMQTGGTVVVLGPGRLGILIVFVAALRGLKVVAISRSESKRKRALEFGASHAFTPEEAESQVQQWTEGLGADLVVEATGNPDSIDLAMSLIRPRGTLSVKTTCGLPAHGLDMTRLVVDEICLQGSRCGPFEPALKLLEGHAQKLKTLITSTPRLAHVQKALESAYHESKVVFEMDC